MNATTPETTKNLSVPRCRCGHDATHPTVRPTKRYGWWGAMVLIMGFTSRPTRIDLICSTCGSVIESITDRKTRERFRYDEPHLDNL
jgi:hypothetical protein